jgi:O-antigen/teichoic acid export membrane protein
MILPLTSALMRYSPRVAEFWQKGEIDRLRAVTRTFTWTTCLLTLAAALAIALAGPWLLWIFGPEFRKSAPLLWIVAGAQVVNAACGPVGMLMVMSGCSGRALAGHLTGLVVNVALGVLLIPTHGAFGAAIAMAIGIVVWNLSMLAMARARFGFDPSVAGMVFASRELR